MSNVVTLTDNKLINNLLIKNLRIWFDGLDPFHPFHAFLWQGNPDESYYIGSKRSRLIQNFYIRFDTKADKVNDIELLARINNANKKFLYSLNNDYIKLHDVDPLEYEFQDMQNFIDSVSDQIIPKLKILNIIFNDAFMTNTVDASGHPLDLETLKREKLTIQKSKVKKFDNGVLSGLALT